MKVEDAHLSKCDFSHGCYRKPGGFERYWVRSSAPSFLISAWCLENNQMRHRDQTVGLRFPAKWLLLLWLAFALKSCFRFYFRMLCFAEFFYDYV